jgi:hypothetical protein
VNQWWQWQCLVSAHDGEKEGGKWCTTMGKWAHIVGATRQWSRVGRT